MKNICAFIFTVLWGIPAIAQSGNIIGKVSGVNGEPVPNATIFLKSNKSGTLSDKDGSFKISCVKPGTYLFVASHTGLKSVERSVKVIENETVEMDIILADSSRQLDQVVVESTKKSNEPVSIGKAPIPVMDLPQATTVIGQTVIRDQQAQRLSDIVKNINGVYLASTRGSTQENFSARGYSFSSSNMFKDGVRVNTGAMPEASSLECVEALKGSAAILYGNVAPGGILNMVTKRPRFERGGEVSMRMGSYDLYKPAIDLYGPLLKNIAYRINGTYESAGSYRDVAGSKRYYINPSMLFKTGNKTEVLVQADYLNHEFTPDFGIGTYDNTRIPDVPIGSFFGTPWQYAKTKQTSATATMKRVLNGTWQLSASASYQHYNRDYYATERIQALANGDFARPLNKIKTDETYYIGQVNLTGSFKTGRISHILLAGLDADRYYTQTYSYNQPTIYDTINILAPAAFVPRTDIPETKEVRLISTPVNRFGAYVQDMVALSPKIRLLAGIRWSYQDARPLDTLTFATNLHSKGITNKVDKAFSPRVGVVYRPTRTTSVFTSYANSFSVNSGTDVYGNALAPSIIDQFEAGVKNEFFKGKLSANLTIYRIINNNLAQTALFGADGVTPNSNTSYKALTGQTTSDGVELDLAAHPLGGLEILAGYSYNYIRYTRTPKAKGNFIEGERLINHPGSTGNASVFYAFRGRGIRGLKVGSSVFYTGTRYAGFNNTQQQTQQYARNFEVKGFTTVDLSAGYSFKRIALLVKVSNVTNTFNYYVHENYSINPIPPRQVIGTVSYRF